MGDARLHDFGGQGERPLDQFAVGFLRRGRRGDLGQHRDCQGAVAAAARALR